MSEKGLALKQGGSGDEPMDTSGVEPEVGHWVDEDGIFNVTEDDEEDSVWMPESEHEQIYWEDVNQLSTEGNCYHCGLAGHFKRDCFRRSRGQPKNSQGRQVSSAANRRNSRGRFTSRSQYGAPRRPFSGGRGTTRGRGSYAPRRSLTTSQRFQNYGTPRVASSLQPEEVEEEKEEIEEAGPSNQDF